MKACIELPIPQPKILTWTDHEGINSPRSGKRHFSHQRSVNLFNIFMNPQWKQTDIENIRISDYPELEESMSSSLSVKEVGRHQCSDYVHVSINNINNNNNNNNTRDFIIRLLNNHVV